MTGQADGRNAVSRIVQIARAIGRGGGVNGVAFNLEQEFARRGWQVERLTADNVPGATIQPRRGASRVFLVALLFRSVFLFSFLARKAYRRIRGPGDITICHNDALMGDIYVAHSVHRSYLEVRGSVASACLRNPLHAFVLFREALRYRLGLHRAVVVLSEGNRRELQRLYPVPPSKVSVIPNGVDLDRFRPDPALRAQVRRELKLNDEVFTFLFVAHEFRKKGLPIVLGALRGLLAQGRDVHLLVAGRDDTHVVKRERQGLEDHVTFLGHRDDVERLFAASDTFVLPTMYESFALVCLEAMASGIPVVATPVHGVEDYMIDERTGYLVARDAPAFRQAMARIMDTPDRAAMGESARRRAEEYGWPSIADRYLALIRDVAAS